MRARRALAAASAVAAAAALVASAGAGLATRPAAKRPQIHQLTNLKQIKGYLRSIGVDPGRVVIQRGLRNYAGPRCPGRAWSCTRARHVVQLAAAPGGANSFQCTPSSSPGPNDCVIVQGAPAPGVDNNATCGLSSTAANVTQTCSITQTNTTGRNNATAGESQSVTGGQSQAGTQKITIRQTNNSGANNASLAQRIVHSESVGGSSVSQSQNASQEYTIVQHAVTGANNAFAAQSTSQTQKANSATSGSQDHRADLLGHVDQFSHGVSASQNSQSETQVQTARGTGVAQTQIGPLGCCSSSGDNPNNTTRINQSSNQTQTPGNGTNDAQSEQQVATYSSSGNVTADQSATQDGTTTTNSASGSTVAAETGCTSDSCTTSPPPSLSINDVSMNEGNAGTTNFVFTVSLSEASGVPATVDYATADGTATAGSDYQATSGTLTFNPGETSKTVTVPVNGDTSVETDEAFFVNLSNAGGATISDPQGQGTIQNDDVVATVDELYVSVGNGQVQQWDVTATPTLQQTLSVPSGSTLNAGLAFDQAGNLLVADFSTNALARSDPNQPGGLGEFVTGIDTHPESVAVDSAGNIYVGVADGIQRIYKFNSNGIQQATYVAATEDRGTDWIAFPPGNDCTLFYTSEGTSVKRFDVCDNAQLSDFKTGLPGTAYAIRILADGGALVADTDNVVRLNSTGQIVQTYNVSNYVHTWFSLTLASSGNAFWAGDVITGDVVEFDLATGAVLKQFATGGQVEGAKANGLAARTVAGPVLQ